MPADPVVVTLGRATTYYAEWQSELALRMAKLLWHRMSQVPMIRVRCITADDFDRQYERQRIRKRRRDKRR